MIPYQLITLLLLTFLAGDSFSQDKSIKSRPTLNDLLEETSDYILGEEGTTSIKLHSDGLNLYWNPDQNYFNWSVSRERRVRLKLSKKQNSIFLFGISNEAERILGIKTTIYFIEKGGVVSEKTAQKKLKIIKKGDSILYSLPLSEVSFPVVIDYSYSTSGWIECSLNKRDSLAWSFADRVFPKRYSKIEFVVPEHFNAESIFNGLLKSEVEEKRGDRSENVIVTHVQKLIGKEVWEKKDITYSQAVQSFSMENVPTQRHASIILSLRQVKKFIIN